MLVDPDDLQRELDKALDKWGRGKDPDMVARIRSVLRTNVEHGRIRKFMDNNRDSIPEYVVRVCENYEQHSAFIRGLQIERLDELWQPLLEQSLYKWACSFLVRKGQPGNPSTWENARDCAIEAARQIHNAHFPFDTDFMPWARRVLQNTCRKHLRKAGREVPVTEDDLDDLKDRLVAAGAGDGDPAAPANEELLDALSQLTDLRRQVIEMKFFQDLSPSEIAAKLGKSVSAVHSLQFHAYRDLRKILGKKGNKLDD